ncbi:hypothetical protein Tco_0853578 [Tanacetum coccineum]
MQAARDRQKSYADLKRKPMEFQVGDKVMLKVSPWKGVVCFGKRGKLNLRYVGPFKVRWNSKRGPEFTWEREDQFKKKYPHLFTKTAPSSSAASYSIIKAGKGLWLVQAEDMQKRRNDVKARTTLLLALPDEHQLRFSKYETAKELWEAILRTFGGNEATKKTKKNLLKQQYGNFKAEGSETLEQTFNRLQAIVSQLEFLDVPVEQEDLNQKSMNQSFSTASGQVTTVSTEVATATFSHDTICAYIATQQSGSQIKYKDITQVDDDDIEEMDSNGNMLLVLSTRSWTEVRRGRLQKGAKGFKEPCHKEMMALMALAVELEALRLKKMKLERNPALRVWEFDEYELFPPTTQVYSSPMLDLSWTGLPEFANNTITDYTRPTPSVDVTNDVRSELDGNNLTVYEHGGTSSNAVSKPIINFVKESRCPNIIKINNIENARKPTAKYAELYRNITQSHNVRSNNFGPPIIEDWDSEDESDT